MSALLADRLAVDTGISAEVISDHNSFLALEPVWDRLVKEAAIDHPFLDHVWVRTWWDAFGPGKELQIVIFRAGSECVAIAPLMFSTRRLCGVKLRRLGFIYNVHTPRFDFIITRHHQEIYRAIWAHVLRERSRWDILELCQLPTGSNTFRDFAALAEADGFRTGLWSSGASPYLPIERSWQAYHKSLSKNHRSNLRKRERRLSRVGAVDLERFCSIEDESCLADGFRLEAVPWKVKAGTAILCRPEVEQFHTLLARRAAERGNLRLHFLTASGRRIAFEYSLLRNDKLFSLKLGWDPEFAPYSPYKLLCGKVLRHSFESGLSEYDFLGLDHDWKLDWTKLTRPHCWLYVLNHAWALRYVHLLKFRLAPGLQRLGPYRALQNRIAGRGEIMD